MNNYRVAGYSAEAIAHFKGRASKTVHGALIDLDAATKFSLGSIGELPEICRITDKEQRFGEIRMPFDLMAIEALDIGGVKMVFLFRRVSPSVVKVFSFFGGVRAEHIKGPWCVAADWVEVQADGDGHHIVSVCNEATDNSDIVSSLKGLEDYAYLTLRTLNALLACNNVNVETVPPPNTKGLGKRKRELLKYEYKILIVRPRRQSGIPASTGSHKSPRLHMRRGHIRHLQSGETIWITQCMVGDSSAGVIRKDYRVKS